MLAANKTNYSVYVETYIDIESVLNSPFEDDYDAIGVI